MVENTSSVVVGTVPMTKTIYGFHTERRKEVIASRKTINNSVYGKTVENLRYRVDLRLIPYAKDYQR